MVRGSSILSSFFTSPKRAGRTRFVTPKDSFDQREWTILLTFAFLLFAIWYFINTDSREVGLAYGLLAVFSLLALAFDYFLASTRNFRFISTFPLVDFRNWKQDVLIGLLVGGIFSIGIIGGLFSFVGIPPTQSLPTDAGKLLTVSFFAPIGEELSFRSVIFGTLLQLTSNLLIAAIVVSIAFSLFHWAAYTTGVSSAEVFNAFGLAFIFSFVQSYVISVRRNLLPLIVSHAVINTVLFVARVLGFVFVVGVLG